MKIKLSTIYASPHVVAQPGSVLDCSDEEGSALIKAGCGTDVTPAPNPVKEPTVEAPVPPNMIIETAALNPPENAAVTPSRSRNRKAS